MIAPYSPALNAMEMNTYESMHKVDQLFQRFKNELTILYGFELIQTIVIIVTLSFGFFILIVSLFTRTRKTVWGLWCSVFCGFVQVSYCATNVIVARTNGTKADLTSIQCSDLYTIPILCDVISMAVLISSAIGFHFRNSRAGSLLKYVLFAYILFCTFVSIALQSGTEVYQLSKLYISPNLSIQTTSCAHYSANDMIIVIGELLLIYSPMGIALLVLYAKAKKNKGKET